MTTPDPRDHGAQHDAAAERALIGAALLDATVPDRTGIQPNDFYSTAAEATWHALATINGAPDRARAVLDHWRDTGQLKVGHTDGPWLISCQEACHSPAAADQYADTVRRDATVRRAHTALTRGIHRLHSGDPAEVLLEVMDVVEDGYRALNGRTQHDDTTWQALDLTDVLAGRHLDPPPQLMTRTDGHHLLYRGAIHTISGEPESGKTWICLHAAAQELHIGNTVAIVDFEDNAGRVIGRLLNLGAHPDQIAASIRYVRPHQAIATRDRDGLWHDHPDAARHLEQAVTGTSLVILDGVTEAMALHGLDLSANPDVAAFYDLLPRRIARRGPAVILIDHVVKDSEKQGRWGIGGQHKLAGIDGVAYLAKAVEPFGRGQRGRARISISKDRPGHVIEHAVGRAAAQFTLDATDTNILRATLDPPDSMPTNDAGDPRPTVLMEKVSRWVETHPNSTRREIVAEVRGKQQYVLRAIDALLSEGYLEVETGERRAQHHRSITPYRAYEADPA